MTILAYAIAGLLTAIIGVGLVVAVVVGSILLSKYILWPIISKII